MRISPANTTRRQLLRAGSALGAGILAGPLAAATRPNILVITTDQQFADAMSCRMGRKFLHTPNMDSLAASGTVFERAYCANPICVPSRTSLFTGRYPVETGVGTNDVTPIDHKRFPCIGTYFKNAGYSTGYFGKWHLPFTMKNTATHGFDVVKWNKASQDVSTMTDVSAFLREKRDAPFFAIASFLNPHNICEWARGQALSEGDVGTPPPVAQCPPRRANYAPETDEPEAITTMRASYHASPVFPVGDFDEAKWRQYIWAYYRMIEMTDAKIGQVLQALRDAGQENNTVVILSADHGDCQGAHGWNQKTVLFEEATRVPFIVSWKGVTRPGVSKRLVNTGIDLFPTIADFAGISVPAGYPGLSLKGAAIGADTTEPRDYVVVSDELAQGAPVNGKKLSPTGRMVRGRRYKYVVYSEGAGRESLVDLDHDPGEMVNLAGNPKLAPVLKQHREALAKWCRQYADKFPFVS